MYKRLTASDGLNRLSHKCIFHFIWTYSRLKVSWTPVLCPVEEVSSSSWFHWFMVDVLGCCGIFCLLVEGRNLTSVLIELVCNSTALVKLRSLQRNSRSFLHHHGPGALVKSEHRRSCFQTFSVCTSCDVVSCWGRFLLILFLLKKENGDPEVCGSPKLCIFLVLLTEYDCGHLNRHYFY